MFAPRVSRESYCTQLMKYGNVLNRVACCNNRYQLSASCSELNDSSEHSSYRARVVGRFCQSFVLPLFPLPQILPDVEPKVELSKEFSV
jgi:hypothetical protein